MGARLQLETFSVSRAGAVSAAAAEQEEEIRSAAYELGYNAGWEDAIAARDSEDSQLRENLARSLADLSFTYHEAHGHVLGAIRPLLLDMVRKVLPAVARETLAPMIVEQILPLAKSLAGAPVEVLVSPGSRAPVEEALSRSISFPLSVVDEPAFGPGQAQLRLGASEVRVDLDGAVSAIAEAVTAFFESDGEEEERPRA
ncbi:MAG: flagellar biosynthesis protein [Paracoccaceae bacterium]